jgi:hypothetical protein
MTTTKHTHRAVTTRDTPFFGPVGPRHRQNPCAHGGVCELEICKCGAERRTNLNGGHIERGTWVTVEVES